MIQRFSVVKTHRRQWIVCVRRNQGLHVEQYDLAFDEALWLSAKLLLTPDWEWGLVLHSGDITSPPPENPEWTLAFEKIDGRFWIVSDGPAFAVFDGSEALAYLAGRGSVGFSLMTYEEHVRRYPSLFREKPIALIPHLTTV